MKSAARWLWLVWASSACLAPRLDSDVTVAAADAAVDVADDATTGDVEDAVDTGAAASPVSADAGGSPPPVDVGVAKGCLSAKDCADFQTACATGECDTATGLCKLVVLPDGASCTTNDACFTGTCQTGACVGQATACDDGNLCTSDSCAGATGCKHDPSAGLCDDGDACTVGDKCANGQCSPGSATPCDDKNPCTVDSCDKALGCVKAPAGAQACDDGIGCTSNDHCEAGKCMGTLLVCPDDGNPCTVDGCDKTTGKCASTPVVLAEGSLGCDDGDPCTIDDLCVNNVCAGKADSCDDKNPCTDDSCLAQQGCQHKPNSAPCPGDACTSQPICQGGACVGVAKSCDDGNACTQDSCTAPGGCQHLSAEGAPCGDGDACTLGDVCVASLCKSGSKIDCDDGDPCSDDACNAALGCSHDPLPPGSVCAPQKTCAGGLCLLPTDGDGWCEAGETTADNAQDCPVSGGQTPADDASKLAECTAALCADVAAVCKGNTPCGTLKSCMTNAADAQSKLNCLLAADPVDRQKWLAWNACVQAFCVSGDHWLGSKCAGSGAPFATCVGACTTAMCPLADAACGADADCAKAVACVDADCANLSGADKQNCVKACGGNSPIFGERAACQLKYCQ